MYRLWIETHANPVLEEESIKTCALVTETIPALRQGAYARRHTDPAIRARPAREYLLASLHEWMFFERAWRTEERAF